MNFLTIERKLYDMSMREIVHIFTDKTSVCLAVLLLSLNGAGKATTTYTLENVILPSLLWKVNAFVRTSRESLKTFGKHGSCLARLFLHSSLYQRGTWSSSRPVPLGGEDRLPLVSANAHTVCSNCSLFFISHRSQREQSRAVGRRATECSSTLWFPSIQQNLVTLKKPSWETLLCKSYDHNAITLHVQH